MIILQINQFGISPGISFKTHYLTSRLVSSLIVLQKTHNKLIQELNKYKNKNWSSGATHIFGGIR